MLLSNDASKTTASHVGKIYTLCATGITLMWRRYTNSMMACNSTGEEEEDQRELERHIVMFPMLAQ